MVYQEAVLVYSERVSQRTQLPAGGAVLQEGDGQVDSHHTGQGLVILYRVR